MIMSREMGGVGHVARMGEMRSAYKMLVGNLKGRNHSEDLGVDGRIILELTLGKYGGKTWIIFIWLKIGTRGGSL
jgi:hypothetical protein